MNYYLSEKRSVAMLRLPFLQLWQTPLTTGIWRGSWPSVHSSLNFQQSGWIKLSLIMLWDSIWVPRCASFWIHHSNSTQRFRVWNTTLITEVPQIHRMEICWACYQRTKDQAFFLTVYAHNHGMQQVRDGDDPLLGWILQCSLHSVLPHRIQTCDGFFT